MVKFTPIVVGALSAVLFPVVASAECSLSRAKEYFGLGYYQDTLNSLRSCSRENASILLYRGASYFRLGRFSFAEAELEGALRLSPNSEPIWYYLGRTYHDIGKAKKERGYLTRSINASRKAMEMNPYDARYWNNVGAAMGDLAYLELNSGNREKALPLFQEAISHFNEALNRNPNLETKRNATNNIKISRTGINQIYSER